MTTADAIMYGFAAVSFLLSLSQVRVKRTVSSVGIRKD